MDENQEIDHIIQSKSYDHWKNAKWEWPVEKDRVVRYRRSPNGVYQEVILQENGHYFYGLYMPDGFVPPEGME